jgi:group II intron reverse transcriptase/maturase
VRQAREYVESGYKWVVDIDLEKFFDRVNHDVLMSLLSKEINDKAVLRLIRKFLESGVMIKGVVKATEIGTPQGGPLSPLLSNIMLDVLDRELEKRGHKFCRYADDCNIYVKSERAGQRVIESIRKFIESRLRLRINKEKSAVANPTERKFLGFSCYNKTDGTVGIKLSVKSRVRLKIRLKELTARSNGKSIAERIKGLNQYLIGWLNYYMPADIKAMLNDTAKWLRRRIRMCLWKSWKNIKCRYDNLRRLGLDDDSARKFSNSRKGYWRIAGSHILSRTVTNKYIAGNLGLIDLTNYYMKLRNA